MISEKFAFGQSDIENSIKVSPDTLFSEESGYGFVTQQNMFSDENLTIPDMCNNFTLPSYLRSEQVLQVKQNADGCYVDSSEICKTVSAEEGRLIPLYFRRLVQRSGNYRVSLKLTGSGEVLVFSGTRRLVYKGCIDKATSVSFTVNVCSVIPRGYTNVHERRSLDISVLGENVILSELEITSVSCPTFYICGDSTVTDQSADIPYAPGTSYSGWGQMLPLHFNGDIAVSNHAHSGLTTESFRSEGHYSIIQASIKPGDYIAFQFAHNDQKLAHLKAYEGYYQRLSDYIDEARKVGANPIIITPLARNTWKADGSGYNDLLEEYAASCFKLGQDKNVPVIDLHRFSMDEILRDGMESSKRYYFPKDYTHTNDFGAYKMARFIAESIRDFKKASSNNPYARLADLLNINTGEWYTTVIPVVPDIPEKYKSQYNGSSEKLFDKLERPDDILLRAEALDMVIKTARFFPTNVFNDLYDDIVGHEWYAGTVQCAYQNGVIPCGMVKNKEFRPEEPVSLEDFLCFLMGAYMSRKTLPKDKTCTFNPTCEDYSLKFIRGAAAIGLIDEHAEMKSHITRRYAADLCTAVEI